MLRRSAETRRQLALVVLALLGLALAAALERPADGRGAVVVPAPDPVRTHDVAVAAHGGQVLPAERGPRAQAATADVTPAPAARLGVRVVDGDGRPRAGALVRAVPAGGEPGDWTVTDADGRTSVAPPSGVAELEVFAPGHSPRRAPVEPLAPGEQRELALVLADPGAALLGRALDERGWALCSRWLDLTLHAAGRPPARQRARSDEQGGFRFELEPRFAGEALEGAQLALLHPSGGRTLLTAALAPRTLRLGANQIGDVVLDETPLVVAGTLTGDAPSLRGVELGVQRLGDDGAWTEVRGVELYPRPGAGFELRGRLAPGAHRLLVTAPAFLPHEPIAFALGQSGLSIELARGGSLGACVLMDAECDALLVPVATAGEAHAGLRARRQSGWRDTSGELRFRWSGLPAGLWDLQLVPAGASEPALELAGLRVEPGRETDDPRLARIDLRGR